MSLHCFVILKVFGRDPPSSGVYQRKRSSLVYDAGYVNDLVLQAWLMEAITLVEKPYVCHGLEVHT